MRGVFYQIPQDAKGLFWIAAKRMLRLFGMPELFNLHPDCLAEVTAEAPYYQELYEGVRSAEPITFDRLRWQLALLREAGIEPKLKNFNLVALIGVAIGFAIVLVWS